MLSHAAPYNKVKVLHYVVCTSARVGSCPRKLVVALHMPLLGFVHVSGRKLVIRRCGVLDTHGIFLVGYFVTLPKNAVPTTEPCLVATFGCFADTHAYCYIMAVEEGLEYARCYTGVVRRIALLMHA